LRKPAATMSTSSLPKAGTTPHPSLEIFRGRPSQDDLFEKPTLIGSGASYMETDLGPAFSKNGYFCPREDGLCLRDIDERKIFKLLFDEAVKLGLR
jgi:hypothetical protein